MSETSGPEKNILFRACPTADMPLVYVLRGTDGDLLIDTGRLPSAHPLDLWLRRRGFHIRYVLLTHGHFDHTSNALFFQKKYGAKVILHEKDAGLYSQTEFLELFPTSPAHAVITRFANRLLKRGVRCPVANVDYPVRDGDTLLLRRLGFDADIVFLPGHTPGSVGVLQGDVLYCGDACSAIGGKYFTALFGTDLPALFESEKKIFALRPAIIAPGHGRLLRMSDIQDMPETPASSS